MFAESLVVNDSCLWCCHSLEKVLFKPCQDCKERCKEDDQVAEVLQPDVEPSAADERRVVKHLRREVKGTFTRAFSGCVSLAKYAIAGCVYLAK